MDPNRMSLEILINYKDHVIVLTLPEKANVFDLFEAITEKTGIFPQHQNLFGQSREGPLTLKDTEIPLVALGITSGQTLLLVEEKPLQPRRKTPTTNPSQIAPEAAKNRRLGTRFLKPVEFLHFLNLTTTDEDEFTAFFESKYGFIHPQFIGNQFSLVFEACKIEKKLMLIFLYGDNLSTKDFCSIVLCQEELSEFLHDQQIPFWVGKVTKEIEYKFHTTFGVSMAFPFLALVGNNKGTLTVLDLYTELMTATEFISKLNAKITVHTMNVEREAKEEAIREIEREEERKLKEEQNNAFQQSLYYDTQKETTKQEENEKIFRRYTKKLEILCKARREALDFISELPLEPPLHSDGTIRVGLRLPDGSRIDRRFTPKDTLGSVFLFCKTRVAEKLTDETFLDEESIPLDQEGPVLPWSIEKYELVQNYPKKTFSLSDSSKTLDLLNFGGQALLFLQRKS